ncbi:MAG TPA: hypothetical protein VFJ58_10855 [Armatimonadota bacterium]|nr:hypothetical protein [Armatimonadota bacterium]
MRKNRFVSVAVAALSAAAILFSTSFMAAPPAAQAAGAKHAAKPHRVNQLERILRALNLTAEQKDQLKAIRKSNREQVVAIRKDTTLAPGQRKAKMKDLRKDTRTKLMAVLTPEQKAKFKSMMKEARQKARAARKAAANGGAAQ